MNFELLASAYTLREGGIWQRVPEQYGKISVRCFLDHVEFHDEGPHAGSGEFHYAGTPLFFHAVKFAIGFKGSWEAQIKSDRDIFDVTLWKMSNFQTPWRDEYKDWEDS